jgi:DNA repair protein RecO (recombination protein O)
MELPAIVVGSVDVGESSRIVRLLTPSEGRISVVVRGARSSKRRWAGLLDPGTRLRADVKKGRGDLAVLANAELIAGPKRARDDLERLAQLAYGCEICAALAPEHHPAPKLYGLLEAWLDLVEAEPGPSPASRVALEAKALTFAGLAPALVRCARCQAVLDDPAMFDAAAGGALHARCGGGAPVLAAACAAVDGLRRTPLAETPAAPLPPGFRWLLSDFARWHLGHDLRSRGLLEEIETR